MPIKESGEMYLESIYILCSSKSFVRSIDIAEYMNFSKPSVSRGIGILKKNGYINVDKDGSITLTESGDSLARKIYERHTTLTKMLTMLGVDKTIAEEDACRMEHVISDQSFHAIKEHLEKAGHHPS